MMTRLKMTMMAGTALTALALAAPAQAQDTIVINLIDTSWTNPVAPAAANPSIDNQPAGGSDTIEWGTPSAPNTMRSGYVFTPVAVPFTVMTGENLANAQVFSLGEFVHNNFPIVADTSITSVQLNFTVGSFDTPMILSQTFTFNHDETTNAAPCADTASPTPCNDFVEITDAFFNEEIVVDDETYFFTLLGFSPLDAGGSIILDEFDNPTFRDEFSTAEERANRARLLAVITQIPFSVPEPVSLSLLGLGLFGLGVAARRRR